MQTASTIRSAAVALFIAGTALASQAAIVTSNNPGGDSFTNPSASNMFQPVGSTGWVYNNVRNNGTVGINSNIPRSGNGSVYLAGTVGPGGDSSKGDIEYYARGLGSLSALDSMFYDWFRKSSSTNTASQHPSLRVLLDADGDLGTNDTGSLIFERIYNGGNIAPVDAWISDSVVSSTKLWNTGLGLGFAFDIDSNGYAYDSSLADWKAYLPNAVIIGFSSGFGSGWGPFEGAVDNIGWNISGASVTTNFEVAAAEVPEPGSLVLLGLGLLAVVAARRRR